MVSFIHLVGIILSHTISLSLVYLIIYTVHQLVPESFGLVFKPDVLVRPAPLRNSSIEHGNATCSEKENPINERQTSRPGSRALCVLQSLILRSKQQYPTLLPHHATQTLMGHLQTTEATTMYIKMVRPPQAQPLEVIPHVQPQQSRRLPMFAISKSKHQPGAKGASVMPSESPWITQMIPSSSATPSSRSFHQVSLDKVSLALCTHQIKQLPQYRSR